MKPNYALHGKTVVLTGAAGGIGRAIAPAIRVNAIAPGPVNTAMVSLDALSWYYFP